MFAIDLFTKQYIGGRWVESDSLDFIDVVSPVSMAPIAKIPAGCISDAQKAMQAATKAFPLWRKTTLQDRLQLMDKLVKELTLRTRILTDIEVAELGSPRAYAKAKHVQYQISRIVHFMALSKTIAPFYKTPGATVYTEPVGPVVAITPWNYPLGQILQKVIPALLMGNTVVLKPSSLAPLSAVVLVDAMDRVGFPPGVINLINGCSKNFGNRLLTNPAMALISFTGSSAKGKRIAKIAAEHCIRTCLELGGKSPSVWCAGMENYRLYAKKLMDSVFCNAGQTCTSLSRLLIPHRMRGRVLALLDKMVTFYSCGNPENPATVVGPVISLKHYQRIRAMLVSAKEAGAKFFVGSIPPETPQNGYFIEPTILIDVTPRMEIWQEEIFGPVLSVMTYRTKEEAIDLANGTRYGLSAHVVGPDDEIQDIVSQLDAGNVFVNDAARDLRAPFGGFKESGWGYESGVEGLREYVRYKSVFDRMKI